MVAFRDYTGPGGKYRAYFKFQGKQYSQIVKTKADGRKWEGEEKKRVEEEAKKTKILMYSRTSKSYLDDVATWMQPGTVQEKFSHYKAFAGFLKKDLPAADVTVEMARTFIRAIQAAKGNKSANRHLRNLKALWNWHRKEGRISENPWSMVTKLPEEDAIKHVPTQEDVFAILMAASPWEKDYLHMLLKTGARPGEIRRLRWDEVNFERRAIFLWTRKRKGGQKTYRAAPMNDTLHEILLRRWKTRGHDTHVFINPETGSPWSKHNHPIKYMMERLCRRAGIEFFDLYSLRHYAAQRLVDNGKASLSDVQKLLGHQRTTTTDNYLKSLSPDLARLGEALEDDFSQIEGESMPKRYAQEDQK
jgi:integrase